ncbi:SLC13 family permease [uncultured Eubacterium sp.]|uniref:SLC13 family permease n=1 Tax=uncultured Eubacterium sp. TaxID=165185 RepID=UPI0015A915E4|nr:SLC13 family permease [uncultured Eubacterium sp.]
MAAQITAVIIFLIMFALIITEKIPRHIATTICSVATIILVFGVCMHSAAALWDTLNFQTFTSVDFWRAGAEATESTKGINWQTIIFIAGMMIMVEGMALSGFFSWLCLTIAKAVRYNTTKIFIMFMILAFVLSMFIDSITVILFLAAITITQSKLLQFNPIPVIIAEIFCSNLGGSSTMCGDPPNIIIGTALHYTFTDFLTNTGVIAIICLVLMIFFFYMCFRKKLGTRNLSEEEIAKMPTPQSAITDKRAFIISTVIFLCAVILLVTHGQTGLTVSTIGIIAAVATCITAGKKSKAILRRVDYPTLVFFTGLFIVVGGLEETGILELIATFIHAISGGNITFIVIIIIWISAVASAIIDNIPFSATMIPIIKSLAVTSGADLSVLAWTLALGTDIGGSATPIGASANVVGIAVASKNGHHISWKQYCKYSIPATLIVITVSMLYIIVRYI